MAALREVRLAVGTLTDRRSTVWKFWVRKSDIYILSRMFGSDTKVSLHSTGDCQWSATGAWVKKVPGRRNADRHLVKWVMPRPNGAAALHVFQVRIPETELRFSGTISAVFPAEHAERAMRLCRWLGITGTPVHGAGYL
jgi:hypothetical protein